MALEFSKSATRKLRRYPAFDWLWSSKVQDAFAKTCREAVLKAREGYRHRLCHMSLSQRTHVGSRARQPVTIFVAHVTPTQRHRLSGCTLWQETWNEKGVLECIASQARPLEGDALHADSREKRLAHMEKKKTLIDVYIPTGNQKRITKQQ